MAGCAFNNKDIARKAGQKSRRGKAKMTLQKESIIDQFEKLTKDIEFKKKFETELKKLEGKDYFMTIGMLLEYIQPKLARTVIAGDPDSPVEHYIVIDAKGVMNARKDK